MLTVQNDWIEYETEPVQARRVAVRGGAACAQRGPVGTQRVLTQAVLAPVARPVPGRGRTQPAPRAPRPVPVRRAPAGKASRLRLTRRGRVVLIVLPSLLLLSGALLAAAPGVAEAAQPAAAHQAATAVVAQH